MTTNELPHETSIEPLPASRRNVGLVARGLGIVVGAGLFVAALNSTEWAPAEVTTQGHVAEQAASDVPFGADAAVLDDIASVLRVATP